MTALVVSDDLGNVSTFPWPEDRSMLANAPFVDLCVAEHLERFPAAGSVSANLDGGVADL